MAYPQGAIAIAEDPFGNNPITTTARTEAIKLTDNRFETGRLPRTFYVSPWSVLTLKDWTITKQPAKATNATVDDVRQEMETYLQTG